MSAQQGDGPKGVRVDKWLWAARFFKTRRLAAEAVKGGRVELDGARAKPAREIRVGQRLAVTKGPYTFEVQVDGISDRRGSATEAEGLYTESEASIERRAQVREERRAVAAATPRVDHRPDRRDRKRLAAFKRGGSE